MATRVDGEVRFSTRRGSSGLSWIVVEVGIVFFAAGVVVLGFFYTAGWGSAKVYSMNEKPERFPSSIVEMVPASFSVFALLCAL